MVDHAKAAKRKLRFTVKAIWDGTHGLLAKSALF